MSEPITSLSNPLIKQARALRQKKARDESGLFLVEGILHTGEAAAAGWQIESLLYCPARLKSDYGRELVERLAARHVHTQPVSETVFESFSEKENPAGIAALVRQKHLRLDQFPPFRLAVALVSPQDPGNIGTILRSIDATGADGLILLEGGADLYHPSTVRASMGSLFWKPIASASFAEFAAWARVGDFRIIGTSAHTASTLVVGRPAPSQPTLLLLGSEQKGLSPDQLSICTDLLSLPMRGRATSLNLAVAAGVFLYMLTSE
jgi:TrmH family RNA methyltransferase